jgi:hypothetical protein
MTVAVTSDTSNSCAMVIFRITSRVPGRDFRGACETSSSGSAATSANPLRLALKQPPRTLSGAARTEPTSH